MKVQHPDKRQFEVATDPPALTDEHGWVDVPTEVAESLIAQGWRKAGGDAPPVSASKAVWVEHAVASGADRDEAEAMTKDELIDNYGEES